MSVNGPCLNCWNAILKFFRRRFCFEIWSVGISSIDPASLVKSIIDSESKTTTIPSPMWILIEAVNKFIADPFVISHNNFIYIFVEEMKYINKVGRIKYYKFDHNHNIVDQGNAISELFHMSYPNVFKFNGEYFLLPETSHFGSTLLYRATSFPDQWVICKTLFNVGMVDPTIFYHQQKWWILFSDNVHDCIQIASSDNLLDSEFHILDDRIFVRDKCNRMAGKPVVVDNRLYIFTQNCSTTYGGSIVVSELIGDLDSNPEVSLIGEIIPSKSHSDGLHTINFFNNISVFDGKRFEFVPIKIIISNIRRLVNFFKNLRSIKL